MTKFPEEMTTAVYDALAMMRLASQVLCNGEIDDRMASELSWILGSCKKRLEPLLDIMEAIDMGDDCNPTPDADLIELGSEVLALHERFRQRRQGLGGSA